ncbi:MAG: sensor histidine kinase [Verrucomicrobiota bacterium]
MVTKRTLSPAVSRIAAISLSFLILVIIGAADYHAGYEYSFATFYLIAIILAFWFVNAWFSVSISILSVLIAVLGDLVSGARYSSDFVAVWIILVRLTFYLMIIWLMGRLKTMQEALETKVAERTAELTTEMARREKLERELLAVSEKEQHRIGHELHDNLCQHLTGTALAGQVLVRKMEAKSLPEAEDLKHIIKLTEEGITMARNTARGLFPVEFNAAGLMSALAELATGKTHRLGVDCRFECSAPVFINDVEVAGHLFRIAQEAVRNAIKHSQARSIVIAFNELEDGILLEIRDDGKGIPETASAGDGMGLRIMKYRASMIDASFELKSGPAGTTLGCRLKPPLRVK